MIEFFLRKQLKASSFNYFHKKVSSQIFDRVICYYTEVAVQRCSVKKMFLEISQNLQENTWARVSFLIKLQASFSFFHRTPQVAASNYNEDDNTALPSSEIKVKY